MKKSKFHNDEILEKFGKLEDKKYIAVMDLEMTCWNTGSWDYKPRSKMEITEIGIEVLDLDYNVVSTHSETVKPIYYPILSDYCKELTGISQEEIQGSRNLSLVSAKLAEQLPDSKEFVWACWGRDAVWLQDEIVAKSYRTKWKGYGHTEFDPRSINVKLCYGKRGGLKKALEFHKLEQVEPAHRALSDAQSTSKLVKKLKLSPLDAQVSNDKTYREALNRERSDMLEKLKKQTKIANEELVYKVFKYVKWDYQMAKNVLNATKLHK